MNIFDGPEPILKHHVPGTHSDGVDNDNVLNPLHDSDTKRKAVLTPTTHIRQLDPKEKKKKKAEAAATSGGSSSTGANKPMTTASSTTPASTTTSSIPPPPAYMPIAPLPRVVDENREDDDEEIDDRDRYHHSHKGPSAAALVMSAKHGSPSK